MGRWHDGYGWRRTSGGDELERQDRAAHEPHARTWWQILWLLARGQLAKDRAASTGDTRTWIGQIAQR
jgi:hypothetical protein